LTPCPPKKEDNADAEEVELECCIN
jgi:hypothetical protein